VTRVCFLGGARYSQPLDNTSKKKFGALKSLGELFVIGFSQDLCPRRFTEHAHFYLLPALPLPVLRYAEIFIVGLPLALWLLFKHGVQVFVAQSPYEGFTAAVAKKTACWLGRRVALVIESHGDFEESLFLYRRILFPGVYRFMMHYITNFTLKHADLLRTISNSTREQLQHLAPGKQIRQFPTWTDIEVFLQRDAKDKDPSLQSIIYAGTIIPIKGIHYLISVFGRIAPDFPQAKLLIIGQEANKAYAVELKAQVSELGLNGRVQFNGEITQVELATWMQRSCVFVLPSISEGLGRVVLEAMAASTPVVGSNIGGIPEIVKDGVTGFLIQPGDEEKLEKQLRWILEHPSESCEMGRRGRAFVERFFSTEVYVEGYRQLFETAQALLLEKGEHASLTL
jgi:glycosyltransferase involved in cell wall biosynthesis